MKRITYSWLLVMMVALFCFGGGTQAAETDIRGGRRPTAAETSLQKGIELYRSGQTEEALSLLRGFVVRNYSSPLLPQAYLYLARIFRDQGRPDEAILYLSRIPAAQRGAEVLLVEGASLIATGEAGRGVDMLKEVSAAALSQPDRDLLYTSRAEGHARLGQFLQALVFLHQGLAQGAGQPAELLEQAHGLLQGRMEETDLAEAAFMFRGTPIGEDATLQLAERVFARGDRQRALQLLGPVVHGTTRFPYRSEAALLYDRLTGNAWLQRAVGVVLPLSGRYATFGQLVRRGMELALEIHNESNPPVRFQYRDGGADPDQSAQAVSALANGERVMAIAGPLTGAASAAAAAQAQQERVPLLSLSQRDGLPESGPYVFRNSLTTRLQVETLVRYAIEDQEMTTFGILYPENKLGREMAELFAWEVERYGGLVLNRQSYPEKATDFRRQIKLLKGEDPDAPDQGREAGPETTPANPEEGGVVPEEPAVAFDALFIPDYAEQVGLIAPQLAFYGIEELPLLGINGWNSPELLRVAGRYVEGAVFVDGFFRHSSYPFVQEFVKLYVEKYGEEPTILEAQGFDVAGILLAALDRSEVRTREDLWMALIQLRNYPGVTGATSFNEQGDAEKVLFLLQVQNGSIVQIN